MLLLWPPTRDRYHERYQGIYRVDIARCSVYMSEHVM